MRHVGAVVGMQDGKGNGTGEVGMQVMRFRRERYKSSTAI